MANYVRYGTPWVNSVSPPALTAAFLTALENVLVQPSGGSESGHYRIAGNGQASGAVISTWITTLSRTTSPVSVTIDTADQAATFLSSPTAVNQNSGGFLVYGTTSGATTNSFCAGNYTVNY